MNQEKTFKKLVSEITLSKDIKVEDVKENVHIADTEFDTDLTLLSTKSDIFNLINQIKQDILIGDNNTGLNEEFFISLKTDIINKLKDNNLHDLYDEDIEKFIAINNDLVRFYCYRYVLFHIKIPIVQ
jgi:hypothetical protein